MDVKNRWGVAIFAKAFMGIPAQQAAKNTRPLCLLPRPYMDTSRFARTNNLWF
jgi:hypothetical protein